MSNQAFPLTGKVHIVNATGEEARIGGEGKLLTADPVRIVGSTFGTVLDTSFWTAATSAGGTTSVSFEVASVLSGPNNSGYGIIKSVRSGFHVMGSPNKLHSYFRIPTVVVADCARRWGMYTAVAALPSDGAYFELSAAGALSCVTCRNSAPTAVPSGSFNGKMGTTYTLDTNVHGMYIQVGTEEVQFFIDSHLLHAVECTTATLMRTTTLPIQFSSQNSAGGTTSGTLECWGAAIERIGPYASAPQYRHATGAATTTCKINPGVLHRVVNNSKLGGTATIYDNTAAGGSIIGIMDLSVFAGLDYMVPFGVGLVVVTTGGSTDITIIYE
jgi:hypothetical protein